MVYHDTLTGVFIPAPNQKRMSEVPFWRYRLPGSYYPTIINLIHLIRHNEPILSASDMTVPHGLFHRRLELAWIV